MLSLQVSLKHDHALAAQVTGSLVVAALPATFAFTAGRRRAPDRDRDRETAAPKPLVVGVVSLVAALASNSRRPPGRAWRWDWPCWR
jgi:hypothetical protein